MFRHIGSFVLALVLIGAAPLARAQAIEQFNLPSQPLADSLRAIGTQTNINVLFDPPLVASYRAPALSARLSVDEALTRLLASTPFKHKFVDERTVVLSTGRNSQAGTSPATETAETSGGMQIAQADSSRSEMAAAQNAQSAPNRAVSDE